MALVLPAHSRALLQQLIGAGGVLLNGQVCTRAAQKIGNRDEVAVDDAMLAALQPAADEECPPEAMALDIVHEDEALLVINKPPGVVTHPGHGNRRGTLQGGLLHHHADAAALIRAGIVHRLDKDTSGLLAVAKTAAAQRRLISQFKSRSIGREYAALVHGDPPATGEIRRPIRRHRHDPLRMAVAAGGKEAVTHFVCRRKWRGYALLACNLMTGRTHQIRVHLEHSGYPIVGDRVYRRHAPPPLPLARRQMLHAAVLRLQHPLSGAPCEWRCELPPDMQAVLAALEAQEK